MTALVKSSLILFFIVFNTLSATADCVSLHGNISWQRIDNDEILLVKGGRPFAKVDLEFGTYIYDSSKVTIIDDFPCSFSNTVFLIDGRVVDVRTIDKF